MCDRAVKNPEMIEVIRASLRMREASLVICRKRTLVEFKTELLGSGLTSYEEQGEVCWQIGDFDGHHCHLDVEAVERVVFGAEPVSCQGGRLNFTVWFLVGQDTGNPYRPDAYFSVTLNRPYHEDGSPRREIIGQIYDLYNWFGKTRGVSAEPEFLSSLELMAEEARVTLNTLSPVSAKTDRMTVKDESSDLNSQAECEEAKKWV